MSLATSLVAPASLSVLAFAFPDMLRTESRLPSAKGTNYDFGTQFTRGDGNNTYQRSSHLMTLLILALSFIPWWGWLLLLFVVLIAIICD